MRIVKRMFPVMLLACSSEPEPSTSESEQESANLDDRSTAEANAYELTMQAGREPRLPISQVFDATQSRGATHTIRFRARCLPIVVNTPWGQIEAEPGIDQCDPGLVVIADKCTTAGCTSQARTVLFNNNSSSAGGNGKGAYLSTMSSFAATYRVIAYSHLLRGTSKVNVEWSTDGANYSTVFSDSGTNGASQIVGGTLVKLGAIRSGDYVGVRTSDDGASVNTGTRLFAFDQTNDRFAFSDGGTTGDRDPMITFDATWSAQPFVIAAKDVARPTDGGPGLEAVADLIRGPIGSESLVPLSGGNCVGTTSANSTTRVDCAGTSTVLAPGQYHAYAYAHTAGKGVGHVMAGGSHPASGIGDSDCGDIQRGRANDLGFTMRLLRDGQVIETRHIPRGAIGSEGFDDPDDPGDTAYDRFLIPFNVTESGHSYSVNIEDNAVFVRGQWGYARNPETTDMKVVSLNIEPHADDAQTTAMMENVGELFGTRVRYHTTGEITDRANHGQWQWEADVIALQEITSFDSAESVLNRIEARTDRDWAVKWALGTYKNSWYWPAYASFAPIFAGSQVFSSTSTNNEIDFTPAQLAAAGCDSMSDLSDEDDGSCRVSIDYSGDGGVNEEHFVVPARTKVTRIGGAAAGSSSRPVAIFNLYMTDGADWVPSGGPRVEKRREGVDTMIDKIEALVAANPTAFAHDGNGDPRWRGNRMVLLGDSNMDNHGCSEVNETLVKLRARFGYAVEVSMAQLDMFNRTMDTHYSGAPITDPRQGIYGSCKDETWSHVPTDWDSTTTGCPFRFEHVEWWHDDPSSPSSDPTIETGEKYAVDPSQWYAWWGATTSGGNGGSRLDTIILVGRGWAYDDPVLRFGTTSDVDFVNHNNDYLGGGVEIMKPSDSSADQDCNADDTPNLVTSSGSYAPTEALKGAGTGEGQPAFCTDHKPIGARLRLSFVR